MDHRQLAAAEMEADAPTAGWQDLQAWHGQDSFSDPSREWVSDTSSNQQSCSEPARADVAADFEQRDEL